MLRLPAEWEEQDFVQLNFPHKQSDWAPYIEDVRPAFLSLANTIAKFQKCLVCYKFDEDVTELVGNEKIILKKVDSNDTWCRDFGAITVEIDGKIKLLDFTFNGWGNKFDASLDNKITSKIFKKYETIDFVLEGGSIDSNGAGVILTTTDCLLEKNRNPQMSKGEIDSKLKELFGAHTIIWLENGFLEGDDTDSHIDMLARFANENTIIYQSCDDESDIHYEALKKMETELAQTGFELVALPWIKAKYFDDERLPMSYANFLLINGACLVPLYDDESDQKALKIFAEVFPDKEIIGIDFSAIVRQHGSLHCLTMQYPKGVLNELT